MSDGRAQVTCAADVIDTAAAPERSLPVDALFKSLAEGSGDHAIAVVLSGGDSGLSVARRVIELHGGQIEATSDGLTTGSEFVIRLPVLVPEEAGDLQPAGPLSTLAAPIALRRRRVLIVDDHDELRKSLARIVRTFGHEVALAKDGPSALALADSFQPDCAILDLSMPGMNGIELGRRLRKVFPRERLTMIALTGFTGTDLHEGCLAAGFDEHLTKPGEIHKLEQLLRGEHLDADRVSG